MPCCCSLKIPQVVGILHSHTLRTYNLKARVGPTQRVKGQKAVNLLFTQEHWQTRKETFWRSNNSFPGVLLEKCNCHPSSDFNVPVQAQNTNSAKRSPQLCCSCAFSWRCFMSFKKSTVNVVVADVKWNLESKLRHQNLITIHNNESLALTFSPAMFLAMENVEVYLSVSFCSDVSFTVLKTKKLIFKLHYSWYQNSVLLFYYNWGLYQSLPRSISP